MKKTKKNFSNSTLGIFFLSSILSSFLTACSDVPSLQSKKIASGFSSTQLSQGVAFVGIFDRTNHKNNIDLNTDYSHFLLYLNQSTNTKTTITTKNKDAVKFIDNKNLENLLGQNLYQTLTQDIQEKNQAANPTLQAI